LESYAKEDRFTDVDDVYVEQAFRDRQPVAADEVIAGAPDGVPARFSEIALAVFEPLLGHREEID
jgi:hypothetical protein